MKIQAGHTFWFDDGGPHLFIVAAVVDGDVLAFPVCSQVPGSDDSCEYDKADGFVRHASYVAYRHGKTWSEATIAESFSSRDGIFRPGPPVTSVAIGRLQAGALKTRFIKRGQRDLLNQAGVRDYKVVRRGAGSSKA